METRAVLLISTFGRTLARWAAFFAIGVAGWSHANGNLPQEQNALLWAILGLVFAAMRFKWE